MDPIASLTIGDEFMCLGEPVVASQVGKPEGTFWDIRVIGTKKEFCGWIRVAIGDEFTEVKL